MGVDAETDVLTNHETERDAEGNTVLIVRCKDRNGVFLPCFAFRLDRAELEKVYTFPLEFIIWKAAHLGQSNDAFPKREPLATTPQSQTFSQPPKSARETIGSVASSGVNDRLTNLTTATPPKIGQS